MKRSLLTFAAILALSAFAFAQDAAKQPTIVVIGTAEIMVPPDEVVFTIDVSKRNKDMNIAKREADIARTKVIELTRRFNIPAQNVKTDYISVEARYNSVRDPQNRIFDEDGDEIGTRVFLGYDVSTTIIVRLTDLSRFEEFFGEVLKSDVTELDSVSFESSEMIDQRKAARVMAMKAAQEKATAMAEAVGQKIGKAISISEGNSEAGRYSFSNVNANSMRSFDRPVAVSQQIATFSPGAIKVTSQVTVTFVLD